MKREIETVMWTRPKLNRLKKAYTQAVADNADTFWFENHEYVVGYAKYLIEFLESKIE